MHLLTSTGKPIAATKSITSAGTHSGVELVLPQKVLKQLDQAGSMVVGLLLTIYIHRAHDYILY